MDNNLQIISDESNDRPQKERNMDIRRIITVWAGLFVISLAWCATATEAGTEKPNIVFILADDLGWNELGCYGDTFHETPNLDRLARGGMRFTDAYTASCVCMPTRSSILSGKYPARNDVTVYLYAMDWDPLFYGAPALDHMPLEEITIAEVLKENGYTTASVGKWHLGREPYYPDKQGFDYSVIGTEHGWPPGGYHLPNEVTFPDMKPGTYLTDYLTDKTLEIIDEIHDKPFFLYVPYHTVHGPIEGRKDLVEHYKQKLKPGDAYNTEYTAMVHCLDENVGRILARLDKYGLTNNTMIVFFSDNGGSSHSGGKKNNVMSNAPLRMGKGYNYEGGHRVPLIISYPPLVKKGVCKIPVMSTDFYPTILQLAGLDLMPAQHMDGLSLLPLLKDPAVKLDRNTLYWHYPHSAPQGGTPAGAIREGDWKLIEFFNDDRIELYNLAEDIGEKRDLVTRKPAIAERLHRKLKAWRKRVDAKMPPKS